jgi:hypothetical protein
LLFACIKKSVVPTTSRRPLSIAYKTCPKEYMNAHGPANSQQTHFSIIIAKGDRKFAEEIIPKGTVGTCL